MPALPCKALESKVLGTTPWSGGNPADPDIVSHDKGIEAVIFAKAGERLLIVGNLLGIEAEHLNVVRLEAVADRQVIGHMDTIETGGFHSDQKIREVGITVKDSKAHGPHLFDTVYSVRDMLHVDEGIGIKVQSCNEVIAGTDIKAYAQR